jgi:alpha-beta hydrolase superfamily lysophospholipase
MKFIIYCLLSIFSLSLYATDFYRIQEASSYRSHFYDVKDHLGGEHRIAAHHWSNNQKKLILLAHGYVDNCAYVKPLARWFLEQGLDVLCLEMPGHGNSSGKRADIEKMEVYADIYRVIFPKVFQLPYQAFSFFGHSTGNVGLIEYLLDGGDHRFDKIIMATPLIRSYLWGLSRFGHRLTHRFLKNYPRRNFSIKDPLHRELLRLDPHPIKSVPAHWFYQLMAWNQDLMKDQRISDEVVHVILAANDTVIDNKFNKKFMEKRFPRSSISVIQDSEHLLHFEREAVRARFYDLLSKILLTN